MNMLKTTASMLFATTLLSGCSTFQEGNVPVCAAIGGVTGAGLGAIESSSMAGTVGLVGGVMSAAYCWVHGDADGDGVVNKTDDCPGTPKGTMVDEVGCPVEVVEVVEAVVEVVAHEEIVVDNLHFAFNSAELTAGDRAVLDGVASRLKDSAANAKLTITGFTDSVGADAYNLKLSERRAVSVANYLVSAGVAQACIDAVGGAGESQSVSDNATPAGRAMDRRVVISIDH